MYRLCLIAVLMAACGSDVLPTDRIDTDVDSDTEERFEPGPDLPSGIAAAFALVQGETRTDTVWQAAEDNLVFCRTYGTEAWIRMASELAADGENGPHIDIDVCGWDGTGSYAAQDASIGQCAEERTFDISWYDDAGQIWRNDAGARDCTLELTTANDQVVGRFSCRGLAPIEDQEGTIDLRNGQFRCTPVEG